MKLMMHLRRRELECAVVGNKWRQWRYQTLIEKLEELHATR